LNPLIVMKMERHMGEHAQLPVGRHDVHRRSAMCLLTYVTSTDGVERQDLCTMLSACIQRPLTGSLPTTSSHFRSIAISTLVTSSPIIAHRCSVRCRDVALRNQACIDGFIHTTRADPSIHVAVEACVIVLKECTCTCTNAAITVIV